MTEIDPVQFGKLVNAVETLTKTVGTLESKVAELTDLASKGRGAWWAAMGLAGLIGAAVHSLKDFLK